jgi:hypothetical protein
MGRMAREIERRHVNRVTDGVHEWCLLFTGKEDVEALARLADPRFRFHNNNFFFIY